MVLVIVCHAAALLAFLPYFYTASGVACAVAGVLLIALPGINIGYHRLLTHRGFRCSRGFERALATLGVLNVQLGPAYWVALHRRHHQLADKPGDPHSPRNGFLRSHLWFLYPISDDTDPLILTRQYTRDLLADPYYAWLEPNDRWFSCIVLPSWLAFFVAGYGFAGLDGAPTAEALRVGLSFLVWGVFVRTVLVWHVTFSINSACHLWGSRPHAQDNQSRNNALLGFLAFGEGWHNNHHADPRCPRHGQAWWQVDLAWLVIRLLAGLRVVSLRQTRPPPSPSPSAD